MIKNSHYLLATVAVVSLGATPALAAGVLAGTDIENTATATYQIGGSPGAVDSNTVTIRVDEVLNVSVTTLDSGSVAIDGTGAVLTFSVTNEGNGPEAFDLTVLESIGGNDFNANVTFVAVDTNNNGIYDPGSDLILTTGVSTPSVDPDDALTVFVGVSLPGGQTDSDASQLRLTAEAATGTGAPGTSFAGQGAGGGDAVVGATGADDDDLGALIVSLGGSPLVALTKSATVADPFGGTQPIPGAIVTYSILATVSGTGSVDLLTVSDAIPAGTTYVPGSLALDSGSLTDAADTDAGEANGSGISVDLGSVTSGASHTVEFDVEVN
ncbi:DUF11 domain-containing protein [Alteraurantiacibacter aquimixticola]|uniref:DUF11 domain-containing protein n=1 Tax=Alteraurantiacibacter aquimixticola TaxID=2489173 RepID=A0A4T3F201_9SPHN|nr:DUF11 domain-containing protein [Alteraurantiacibacter aquimixticola]TIX51253.1 DUF11 domain-containing protein [Alteraurantiacibacter aquimixticola]